MKEKQVHMTEENRIQANPAIYWLNKIPFLGPVSINKMRCHAGGFSAIYNIEGTEWIRQGILKEKM